MGSRGRPLLDSCRAPAAITTGGYRGAQHPRCIGQHLGQRPPLSREGAAHSFNYTQPPYQQAAIRVHGIPVASGSSGTAPRVWGGGRPPLYP